MLSSALRFLAGAALAAFVWFFATPAYNAVLATAAQTLLRVDPRLRHVEARAVDARIQARGNASQADLPGVVIPADQLTYNIVLFAGLFATNRNLLRDRGLRRLIIALLILFATHIAAVAVSIESTYATSFGVWSDRNYGGFAQDFWAAVEYAYRLAGMFGIAFACWWVSVPSADRTGLERSAA